MNWIKFLNKKIIMIGLVLIINSMLVTACVKLADNESETALEENGNIAEGSSETTKNETVEESDDGSDALRELPFYNLELVLPDGKGNDVDLSEYKGKLLFLNFFATWCGPCNDEMVLFESYYQQYRDDLEIILVNLNHTSAEGSVEDVYRWYDEGEYSMPLVFDMDGSETKDYLTYIQGIPTTFVYDENGNFLFYIPGALNEENMDLILSEFVND